MSFDLNDIKLKEFGQKLQITIFDLEGRVHASCDSILETNQGSSVFDQFLFLKSLEEVFEAMAEGEEQRFSEVEWEEGKKGLFHLIFKKILSKDTPLVQWTIIDNTFYYDKLLNLQQSRNDSAISEEFAQIKKRVIEAERDLLEFKNDELQRIQAFKSQFFAEVSHEMRTPLNSITGLADLLNTEAKPDYLNAIKSTSQHLNAIINDILDLSKIESGKLTFEEIDFDLRAVLDAIVDSFRFQCQQKGIRLKTTLPERVVVKGDPTRLSQVLFNLLGNSIKFTETGFVSLIAKSSNKNDKCNLHFEVQDSGIGMDEVGIKKILEPYEQANQETARLYGGTGLGLSIAKKLIEELGGELSIDSEIDKGTTMSFAFDLPKGNEESLVKEPDAGNRVDLSGLRILIAEDDEISGSVMSQQLAEHRASVQLVENGNEAIAILKSSHFDLFITDVNLPGKTGLEVLTEIRRGKSEIPTLLVSGDVIDLEGKRLSNCHFLIKPIETVDLIRAIGELIHDQSNEIKVDLSGMKSMIDDEAFINDLLQTVLATLPEELEKLIKMSSKQDISEIRKTLHKIKPSITYLGVDWLTEARSALYTRVQDNEVDAAFELDIQSFKAKVEKALESLAKELR